jgi:hypothetical protein
MSDHQHGGPPPGEAPRWLDHPENVKKLTKGFFGTCLVFFLADIIFFMVHKHSTFQPAEWMATADEQHFHLTGAAENAESFFGFYSFYGLIAIILLVVLSVGLRKIVMQPEDFYSRDYNEPEDPDDSDHSGQNGEANHG